MLLIMGISRTLQARVTGQCLNCHTMHASQGGSIAWYGGSTGPFPALTRGNCYGCHTYDTTSAVASFGGSKIPQVLHSDYTNNLAAGNFNYIKDASGSADHKGHNVAAVNQEGDASKFPPPGDEHSNSSINAENFTCAGANGCHGDREVTDQMASMKGAHHEKDSTIDGSGVGKSYRFLNGVKGVENNDATYPWENRSATLHNEYKGMTGTGSSDVSKTSPGSHNTISGLCAECHGNYHYSDDIGGTSSPWLRHPTDVTLPTNGEYASYNTYSVLAPVARVTPASPSQTVTPGGNDNDIVMCLSCHGAHATNYYKMMRWDYKAPDVTTAYSGCNICHTKKD